MDSCPNCGNTVPKWKLMFLTNLNAITCPTCSTRLQVKNKTVSSLIGGIGGGLGGGLGTLLLFFWMITKETSYIMVYVALLTLIFFAGWLASIKFVKFAKYSQNSPIQ